MTTVESLSLAIGRFHPLVVHLPIGFLMLAFIMEMATRWERFRLLESAISFGLFLGGAGAIVACAMGYLLSLSGDYDLDTLWWHQWTGIGTAFLAFGCYFIKTKKVKWLGLSTRQVAFFSQLGLIGFLSFAGHMGGNLTHGESYLTEHLPWNKKAPKIPLPSDFDSVLVYHHLIEPMLEKRCMSCHNSSKKKGKLNLSTPEEIIKGGEQGAVLVAGKLAESELYLRITLPPDHEEFMPTDGKKALEEEEVELIAWWIEQAGATFEKRIGDFEVTEKVRKLITEKLKINGTVAAGLVANLPTIPADKIREIENSGFVIRSLMGDFQLLDVTLIEQPKDLDASVEDRFSLLQPYADQIIWLNLSGQSIQDSDLSSLSHFKKIQKLRLDKNPISDGGLIQVQMLQNLESLNLVDTKVTKESLKILDGFPKLKTVFLWQSELKEEEASDFLASHPEMKLVFGAE